MLISSKLNAYVRFSAVAPQLLAVLLRTTRRGLSKQLFRTTFAGPVSAKRLHRITEDVVASRTHVLLHLGEIILKQVRQVNQY